MRPPRTDERGNEEKYKIDGKYWEGFHDTLPDTIPNKIILALQRVAL